MDKLKEFQKYQFWVLLAVALILPLVGWIMARSGLVAAAEARTKVLDDLSKDLRAGPEDPNQDWETKLSQLNKVQEDQVRQAWLHLYANQAELMTWPENIDPEVMGSKDVELYRRFYAKELEKIRQKVKPLDDERGELVEEPGRLVNLPDGLMPHPDVDWVQIPPTPKQVFAAQEDLWLLTALLDAIASVNENATSQLDAPIREVVDLVLRGGSPKSPGGAKSATPTTSGGAVGMMGGMAEMMKNMQNMRSQDGGASGGGAGIDSARFNPDDEMGEQVEDKDASKTATTTTPTTSGGAVGMMGGMADMMKSMGGGMNRTTSTANMKRYVEDKQAEWKTRGFYLEVIMDQRQVPHLMVALSNAEWPIRITRVHQADLNEETLAGGSTGGPPGMMGGYPGSGGRPGSGAGAGLDMMKKMMGATGGRPGMGSGPSPMRNPSRDRDDDDGPGPLGGPGRPSRPGPRMDASGRSDGMSPLDDPMLVTVAIDGVFTIFNKPPEDKTAPAPGSQSPQQALPATAGQEGAAPQASTVTPAEAVGPTESASEGTEAPAAGATDDTSGKTDADADPAPESPPASDVPASEDKPAPDAKPASP